MIPRARRALLAALAICALGAGRQAPPEDWSHDLNVTIDPEAGIVRVSDRAVAGGGAETGRAPLRFTLAQTLRLTALRINGADRLDALQATGEPGPGGLRAFGGPEIAAGDRIDLSYEGPLAEGDVPRVSAEGAALPADAGWIPAFGGGAAMHSITVRAPASWRVLCPGRPDTAPAGSARFRAEGLTRGLTVAAGPWQTTTRARPGMGLSVHLRERDPDRAGALLDQAAAALDRLEPLLGRYPWRRLDLVESPCTTRAAQPTLILVGPGITPREVMRLLARQWWGAFVGPADPATDWTGGLAGAVALMIEGEEDEATARERLLMLQRLQPHAPADTHPGAGSGMESDDLDARAALVFAQLRRVTGDEVFSQALRDVGARFGSRTAAWPDLRHSFESLAGRDLGWFFHQWTERPGLPHPALGDVKVQREGSGYRLTGTIVQPGDPWRLAVPLGITTLAHEAAPARSHVVEAGSASAAFSFVISGRPVAIRLDPRLEIPREFAAGEDPPSLRTTLASERVLCVVPAAVFASAGHPYQSMAQAAMAGRPGRIVSDDELREEDLAGRSLFVIGRPDENRVARRLASLLAPAIRLSPTGFALEGGSCAGADCALMYSARHPLDQAHHVTWFFGLSPQAPARAAQALVESWDTWVIFRGGIPVGRGARAGDDPEALRLLVEADPPVDDPQTPLVAAALTAARDEAALATVMEEALSAAGAPPGGARRPFTVSRATRPQDVERAATVKLQRDGEVTAFPGLAFPFAAPSGHVEPSDSILVAPEDLAGMGAWPAPASIPSFEGHVILSIERPADEGTSAMLAGMLEGARRLGARALVLLRPGDGPSAHQALLRDASADPTASLPLGGPSPPLLVVSAGPDPGVELLGRQAFTRLATPPDALPPSARFSPWLLDVRIGIEADVDHVEGGGSNLLGMAAGAGPAGPGEVVVLLAPRDAAHAAGLEILAAAARWAASQRRPPRGVVLAAIDPAAGALAATRALAAELDAAGLSPTAVVALDLPASLPAGALLRVVAATPPLDLLARGAAQAAGVPLAWWREGEAPGDLLAPFEARDIPVLGIGLAGTAGTPGAAQPAEASNGSAGMTPRVGRLITAVLSLLGG